MAENSDKSSLGIWKWFLLAFLLKAAWEAYRVYPAPNSTYSNEATFGSFILLMAVWMGLGMAFFFLDRLPEKWVMPLTWAWLLAGSLLWWFVDDAPFSGYPTYIERAGKIHFFSVTILGLPLASLLYLGNPKPTESAKQPSSPFRLLFLIGLTASGLLFLVALATTGPTLVLALSATVSVLCGLILMLLDQKKAASPEKKEVPPVGWGLRVGLAFCGLWLVLGILVIAIWTVADEGLIEIHNSQPRAWYIFMGYLIPILFAPLSLYLFLGKLKKKKA